MNIDAWDWLVTVWTFTFSSNVTVTAFSLPSSQFVSYYIYDSSDNLLFTLSIDNYSTPNSSSASSICSSSNYYPYYCVIWSWNISLLWWSTYYVKVDWQYMQLSEGWIEDTIWNNDVTFSPAYISSRDWYFSPFFWWFIDYTISSVTPSVPEITVYYNNWSSTSIVCDWENSIAINWLSTLYWTSTFIPFFNISYVDENNQKLIESYDKEILYLDPWQFKKTYTWNNDWILSIQSQWWSTPDIIFTWESLPVEITWSSDNVFSNFWDNALALIYWNIPWFITGAVILFLIFLIIRLFIPKNRR
jgi:hypothetical protein